jgi:hypothetical protein
MLIDYTLENKPFGFYPPLPPSECRGIFRDDNHFEHFKNVEDNRGRKVTNVRIVKG